MPASKSLYCFLNGKILPEQQAHVSLHDIGLIRSFGVSEVMRSYGGTTFLFGDHMARFFRSASSLGLKVPLSPNKIEKVILALLEKNQIDEAQIRMILTGGEAISGILFDKQYPTFFILIEKFIPFPHALYKKGAKLITYEYERTFPTLKTTGYIAAVAQQARRIKEKAVEILFISKGKVFEPSTSNICIVKNNTVVTPKENVLAGTTLNFTLSLAHSFYAIERREVTLKELLLADEVFITATNKEIIPIIDVDGKKIGTGKPGSVTKHLINLFRERSGSDVMPRL